MEPKPDSGALCPSCERFIGPADVCPYCESESAKSPVIRRLRILAGIMAVLGLACVHLMARQKESEEIKIAGISPTMNYAVVAASGCVEGKVRVRNVDDVVNQLSFRMRDETGELRVTAFGNVARNIAESGDLPGDGDHVRVRGSVNIDAQGRATMRLHRLLIEKDVPGAPPRGKDLAIREAAK